MEKNLKYIYVCVCMKITQSCLTLQRHGLACQAALSMAFSRQEYWSGMLCPPPGNLPDPGIEPMGSIMLSSLPEESMSLLLSPAQVGGFFTTSATWGAGGICSKENLFIFTYIYIYIYIYYPFTVYCDLVEI